MVGVVMGLRVMDRCTSAPVAVGSRGDLGVGHGVLGNVRYRMM